MSRSAQVSARGSWLSSSPGVRSASEAGNRGVVSSVREEQVSSLVQRVFFVPDGPQIRHVAFVGADTAIDSVQLGIDIAHNLARRATHDVALVDGGANSIRAERTLPNEKALESRAVEIEPQPEFAERVGSCNAKPRLWTISQGDWIDKSSHSGSASRLRDLTNQFDFSIVCCGEISSLTMAVAGVCDGVVLILAANHTRRIVAQKIKERFEKAAIPLLGTVLTERRFPIPESLYRNL